MSGRYDNYGPERGLPASITTGMGIGVVVFIILCVCRFGYDRARANRQALSLAITEDMMRSVNIETIKQVLDQWLVTTVSK